MSDGTSDILMRRVEDLLRLFPYPVILTALHLQALRTDRKARG